VPCAVRALHSALPPLAMIGRWTMLFSTAQHGHSLRTLYHLAGQARPTILVVKDARGNVFGGFVSAPWCHDQSTVRGYAIAVYAHPARTYMSFIMARPYNA
jgi:hypothetical protein